MKCLKICLLLLLFTLPSCQSNLQKAGQSHALTFKKWQALSKYASASHLSNHPSLHIVGELTVDSSEQDKKFILTNIKLSATETAFQINLLHPQFESKYICAPQCLQLTEYLQQDAEGNTMLTRYFEQHEFELFKLYGEIFTLDEKIQEKKVIASEYFDHYINWVINQQASSGDINSFIVFLRRIFSEQAYVSFITQPQQLYSHLIQSADDGGLGTAGSETALWSDSSASATVLWSDTATTETAIWSDASASETTIWSDAAGSETVLWSDTAASETVLWSDTAASETVLWRDTATTETAIWSDASAAETAMWSDAAVSETVLWRNAATADGDLIPGERHENQAEQQWQSVRKLNIELGDLVCSATNNEFGSVREIRGKNIMVELVGKILSYSDGVSVATKPSDIFNNNIVKNYTPVDKIIKTYDKSQLSKCHLE